MDKILIVDSGGRGHAIGYSIAQDPDVGVVWYAPGNAGTHKEEKGNNVKIDCSDKANFGALADFVETQGIDKIVVGPEKPLVDGIVDFFNKKGFKNIFGPTSAASLIESDKFYSYGMMEELNIPQAESMLCETTAQAEDAIKKMATEFGVVIKARGLTGGKGVYVCDSSDEALARLKEHTEEYGPQVLISERLFGQEFSVFGLSDGIKFLPLEMSVQDHKPLLDGDFGPNTGGMGAYCPAPIADRKLVREISDKMMAPVVEKMRADGREYKGFLYAAVIMTEDGPKILEYNCRLGDPETQPLMMMLEDGLYRPIKYALQGRLHEADIRFKKGAACCVVMTANGYPDSNFAKHVKGLPIGGLEEVAEDGLAKVFHAGTTFDAEGNVVVNGGRVLGVTVHHGGGIRYAQELAYDAVHQINEATVDLNNKLVFIFRNDIADKAFE